MQSSRAEKISRNAAVPTANSSDSNKDGEGLLQLSYIFRWVIFIVQKYSDITKTIFWYKQRRQPLCLCQAAPFYDFSGMHQVWMTLTNENQQHIREFTS